MSYQILLLVCSVIKNPIINVLDNLLEKEEFLACMIADHNLNYIIPTSEKSNPIVKENISDLKRNMNNIFKIIDSYSKLKLEKMKWTFTDYDAWFYIFPDFQSTLIAIVPTLSNEGLIEVELEKARLKILEINKKNR